MRIYKALISAVVDITGTVKEYNNGEIEIIEVDEVREINDFDNVRPLD